MKNHILSALLFWGFVMICPLQASAGQLTLDGNLKQGGAVIGQTDKGSMVSLNGKPVRVSPLGVFLIGFDRDHPSTAELLISHPDGSTTQKTLNIEQREYDIQRIDGLPPSKVTPRKPEDLARIKADNAGIATVRRLDTDWAMYVSRFQWPVKGRLSGVFGSQRVLNGKPNRPHNGVDIAAKPGTEIVAMADGIVALVHEDMFYSGKTVMLDHGHGLNSVYIHMSEILVQKGQRLKKGAPLGAVGMTGRATGPHLHWGVSLFNMVLDPALLAGDM